MAYDDKFYKLYQKYLEEDTVRNAHDWIFSMLGDFGHDVLDLGCGDCNEFHEYETNHIYYTGIDLNAEEIDNDNRHIIKGNYRDRKVLKSVMDKEHTSFVSLFSSEITAPYKENYKLYNWIFENFPNIRTGLVSGFYYETKRHKNPVKEVGGIVSYQTLETLMDCHRRGYTEKRFIVAVPSKLFGPDVVEVWKLFERI